MDELDLKTRVSQFNFNVPIGAGAQRGRVTLATSSTTRLIYSFLGINPKGIIPKSLGLQAFTTVGDQRSLSKAEILLTSQFLLNGTSVQGFQLGTVTDNTGGVIIGNPTYSTVVTMTAGNNQNIPVSRQLANAWFPVTLYYALETPIVAANTEINLRVNFEFYNPVDFEGDL